jgi:hypothetical protein
MVRDQNRSHYSEEEKNFCPLLKLNLDYLLVSRMPGPYADISRIYLVETRHTEVWSLVKTYTARGNKGVLYKVQWLTCVKKSSIIESPWICRRLHWIQKLRYPCNKLVLTAVIQHFRTTPKPHVTGMRETPARCVWTKDNIGAPLTVTMFPVPFLGFCFVRLRKCRNISFKRAMTPSTSVPIIFSD